MKLDAIARLQTFIAAHARAWADFSTVYPTTIGGAPVLAFDFDQKRGAFVLVDANGCEYRFRLFCERIAGFTTPEGAWILQENGNPIQL